MANDAVIDTLIGEAGGEGEKGLTAAAWAIVQRAAARGQTIDQVVRSGFDGFSNPGSAARRAQQDPKVRARVERILNGVVDGSIPNPVPGADHFLSGSVMPSWAKGMKLVATVGNTRYYASGNVPQAAYGRYIPSGELPEVGTLTDTVPSRAVPPATISPRLAALRDMTSPSRGNTDLQTALGHEVAIRRNAVTPAVRGGVLPTRPSGEINSTMAGLTQDSAMARALAARLAPPPSLAPRGPLNTDPGGVVNTINNAAGSTNQALENTLQKYAARRIAGDNRNVGQSQIERSPTPVRQSLIERGPSRVAALPSLPRPRPQTAPPDLISVSMQRAAATNPTRLPPIAPPSIPGITPASQRVAADTRLMREAVALPSPIGRPPAERMVQSVPVNVAPIPAGPDERLAARTNPNLPQNQVSRPPTPLPRLTAAAPFVPEARYIEPRNVAPRGGSSVMADYAYNTRSLPVNANAPERLTPTPMAGRLAAPPTVVFDRSYSPAEVTGTVGQTIRPTGPLAPLPRQTIARVPLPADPYRAVGTALDTAMPALPRARPNLGMGGVDIDVPAPTPMPRLQRPGLFGRPQLFGHDIPLPGIFGVLQNATMAMNNASGPFNNGADNSLYGLMRGGDFNARGAATAQSGGFLYAPKLGGGLVNVGRVNPALTGAALYDSRNTRNDSRDDVANRVNGSNTRGSGGARSLLD